MMSGKPRIYIMGPYTKGDPVRNTRNAIETADTISILGGIPFCPHLFHFWHLVCPHDYDFWLEQDFAWLETCDAAYRIPGDSFGAEKEAKRCAELKIEIFYNTQDLMRFLENWSYTHGN